MHHCIGLKILCFTLITGLPGAIVALEVAVDHKQLRGPNPK